MTADVLVVCRLEHDIPDKLAAAHSAQHREDQDTEAVPKTAGRVASGESAERTCAGSDLADAPGVTAAQTAGGVLLDSAGAPVDAEQIGSGGQAGDAEALGVVRAEQDAAEPHCDAGRKGQQATKASPWLRQ